MDKFLAPRFSLFSEEAYRDSLKAQEELRLRTVFAEEHARNEEQATNKPVPEDFTVTPRMLPCIKQVDESHALGRLELRVGKALVSGGTVYYSGNHGSESVVHDWLYKIMRSRGVVEMERKNGEWEYRLNTKLYKGAEVPRLI